MPRKDWLPKTDRLRQNRDGLSTPPFDELKLACFCAT